MERVLNALKSKTDKRLYRYVELNNKLRCLLVSDDTTESSAAALDVKVGSLNDPREFQGLAHFCEHMLFLGTKKYPNENEYSSFIKNHGGDKNAYTAALDTNYHFSVANSAFPGALDRFSQFFKEPLFNPGSTERELQAVDSEHRKNIHNDGRRLGQVLLSHANPESRLNRFSTGNLETLRRPGVRDALVRFHDANYSANLMTLALVGKHPLDTMEKWASECFSDVQNKDLSVLDTSYPVAYDNSRLCKLYKVVPISPKHILRVKWLIPDLRKQYRTKPDYYISNLLGHEGPNSLLSYLLDEELALSLSSAVQNEEANTAFMSVGIDLTEKGVAQYERVIELVSACANMLRDTCPQKYIFDESAHMHRLMFDYKSPSDAYDLASDLADTLHDYPKPILSDLLSGPYLETEYDPTAISRVLDCMTPENMIAILSSPLCAAEANREEKWYKTKYSVSDLPPRFREKLRSVRVSPSFHGKVLGLPPPNPVIPAKVNLLPMANDLPTTPRLLKETAGSSVWYKQDHRFAVPKAYGFCDIFTNDNHHPTSPEASMLSHFYLSIFFEDIREFMYMAELAGVDCGLSSSDGAFNMHFYGFSDSIPRVVDEFLKRLKAFEPGKYERLFGLRHTQIEKGLKSALLATPYSVAMGNVGVALSSYGTTIERRLDLLSRIDFPQFLNYSRSWLKNARFEWYIAGNMTGAAAMDSALKAETSLGCKTLEKEMITRNRTVQIPAHTEYVITSRAANPRETNSCIVSHFQGLPYLDSEISCWCLNELAFEVMNEPAFDTLRTKMQLGYIVSTHTYNLNRVLGGNIVVQSTKMVPERLYQKINEFLATMKERMNRLTDAEFRQYVESVSVPIRQKYLSLIEESLCYWREISNNEYMFDRDQQKLAALGKLRKEELQRYFADLLYDNVRRYDYEVVSQVHEQDNVLAKGINKAEALKRGNRRIEVANEVQMREMNSIYPDFYLVNSRRNNTTL